MTTAQKTKTQLKSFPTPSPLATPTDLTPQEVQAVTTAVNPLIADAFALYVKTKDFHWHLAGSQVRTSATITCSSTSMLRPFSNPWMSWLSVCAV
jgi:hypothetical protein